MFKIENTVVTLWLGWPIASIETSYQDVKYLLELWYPEFEHVHWQLDVFWNSLEKWDDFEYWMMRYEKGISLLVKDWVRGLETGEVIGIVTLIPVAKTLLTVEPVRVYKMRSGYE